MQAVSQLPPKFAITSTIKENKIQVEFQKVMVKQRWNIRVEDEKRTTDKIKEAEERQEEEHALYDGQNN